MADVKVKTLRATDEAMEKLKAIAEELGAKNQGAALESLIDLWERDNARSMLPERQTEIDDFNVLLRKIGNAYMGSLQLNADTEERVREEFGRRLRANEEAIASLTEKRQEAIEKAQAAVLEAQTATDALKAADEEHKREIQQLQDTIAQLKENIAGKDNLIEAVKRGNNADQARIESLEAAAKNANALTQRVSELEKTLAAAEREKEKAQAEAVKVAEHAQVEIAQAKAQAQADANEKIAAILERFSSNR